MSPEQIREYTDFIDELANAAADITLAHFKKPVEITNKGRKLNSDFDPVTVADRGAEKAIRKLIRARYPDHDILGEEGGEESHGIESWVERWKWVIDPIDGTRAFISGIPTWGTLVALHDGERPVIGLMDQPYLKERYLGTPDGAFLNGEKIACRDCTDISTATLSTTDPTQFFATDEDRKAFERVAAKANLVRNGYDCYAYAMVAAGHMDVVIESGLEAYDIQAMIPLVEGAGGMLTDWSGGAADQGGQVVASANKELHKQVLGLING